ncbi:hypothetical protein C7U60_05045 [Mesorhizobium plurifarium]|uniref:hypothetical protein n=1 Tax=Sinorhizobium arboris TaxID=76745 RepID=UPI000415128D|nr:hypothetical protein [Sinorhizobium arboris]PST26387.1 hypothetical protein C7U60_05045 [Mesorhizobium plurifarium]
MAAPQSTMDIALPAPPPPAGDAAIPMALLELELSLDRFSGNKDDFVGFTHKVAHDIGAELLFILPASGLVDDCETIAAVRHGRTEDNTPIILFICLAQDDATIRVEQPSERTAGLKSFAESFVGVLERI